MCFRTDTYQQIMLSSKLSMHLHMLETLGQLAGSLNFNYKCRLSADRSSRQSTEFITLIHHILLSIR